MENFHPDHSLSDLKKKGKKEIGLTCWLVWLILLFYGINGKHWKRKEMSFDAGGNRADYLSQWVKLQASESAWFSIVRKISVRLNQEDLGQTTKSNPAVNKTCFTPKQDNEEFRGYLFVVFHLTNDSYHSAQLFQISWSKKLLYSMIICDLRMSKKYSILFCWDIWLSLFAFSCSGAVRETVLNSVLTRNLSSSNPTM